ncbi:MAG: HAD family hydrolase [Clostridia bacterium]|nr:HAD family hydrolase [Clostridia bacterium]
MNSFTDFENYIFDFYGTLAGVHTDEASYPFWEKMAGWYSVFGADYLPEELAEKYRGMVAEEEEKLRKSTGCRFPEIKLETVFVRLLLEATPRRRAEKFPAPGEISRWAVDTANAFRIASRDYLAPFDGAKELLSLLRAKGKKVYLLSNAQAVFTVPEIERCGMAESFDDIWLSSDHGVRKPDPSFLTCLMKKHNMAQDRTVMIGNDWYADMGVAASCGVFGMWVNSDGRSGAEKAASRDMIRKEYGEDAAGRICESESIAKLVKTFN